MTQEEVTLEIFEVEGDTSKLALRISSLDHPQKAPQTFHVDHSHLEEQMSPFLGSSDLLHYYTTSRLVDALTEVKETIETLDSEFREDADKLLKAIRDKASEALETISGTSPNLPPLNP